MYEAQISPALSSTSTKISECPQAYQDYQAYAEDWTEPRGQPYFAKEIRSEALFNSKRKLAQVEQQSNPPEDKLQELKKKIRLIEEQIDVQMISCARSSSPH